MTGILRGRRSAVSLAAGLTLIAGLIVAMAPASAATANEEPAGTIEVWGNGGRLTFDEHSYVSVSHGPGVLSAIDTDGRFHLLQGGSFVQTALPAAVDGQPVLAASTPVQSHGGAVMPDGSVHLWGIPFGIPKGHFTPEQLGGKATDVAFAGALATMLLEDGRVSLLSATTGDPELVMRDWDEQIPLTDAVAVYRDGLILRSDGSIVFVTAANALHTVMPANANDPIVYFDESIGIRQSGAVFSVTAAVDGWSNITDYVPDIPGNIVEVASGGRCAALSDTGQVGVWDCGSSAPVPENFQVPAEIQGRVLSLFSTGSGSTTTARLVAIVGDTDTEPDEISNIVPPAISGTPQVGETLTASGGTWTPEEVTLAHQWLRDGEEIADVTGTSYELTSDDEGARISVRVTASHDDLDSVSATSAETEIVQAAPVEDVVNNTAPAITGTAKVGETLNASSGDWTPADANLAYQWLRDGSPIGSATEDSYELVAADQGAKISVRVTASKTGYNSASATSDETAEVAPADLAVTSVPVISGTPQEGHTLAGTPAVFNDPTATVTNRWLADGDVITGETGTSLELTADHVGKRISFESTAVRGDDSLDSVSAETEPVVRADIELSIQTPATLSGTPRVGQTLTATEAEFGGDIDHVTHEWLADGTVLSGASGTSLELTSAHVGKTITFRSTAVRGENSLPSVSDPVGPVLVVLGVTTKPSISGTAEVGRTLTGTPAVFNDVAAVITNQWFADGVAISGATGANLELTADHLGAVITFKSTATRGSDTVDSTSDATDAVKLKALEATSAASIRGTAQVGKTLTGTPAEFNDATAVITNQWFADGVAISGETGLTLAITADLVGKRITFVSTATRGDDTLESASAASAAVAPETPEGDFDGKITLNEVVKAGETVTVTVGEAFAGQEVEIWMFSTPRMIGAGTVSAAGTIRVTIPADAELGDHIVAAYDEAGDLIGFQGITVVAADGSGGGGKGSGSSGSGSGHGAGSSGLLTRTGVEIGKVALPIGAALLALGFAALVIARRRTI